MLDALLAALESDTTLEAGGPFLSLAAAHFAGTRDGTGPVSTPRDAREIAARFDEPLPMGTRPLADIVARLDRDVMPDVNRLSHPMYLGHQVSAPLAAAVWSEVVISAINNSVAVWEMSPVGTVLEERVITWMRTLAGFGEAAGGTFTSGGTEATFTALLAARATLQPDAWTHGLRGPLPVLVHGEHAHYAVSRAAGELGIGTANCVAVPSRDFRMDERELARTLERLHAEGRPVLAVVATAGSTATGSFDDLEAIAATCERFGAWLHVDGAHGASALLSARHCHRVAGLARARTVAWDPHKMMLLPLTAGTLIARDVNDITAAFAQRAPYLFHVREGERSIDLGTRSFQCSRRADVLKAWVALQRLGADGIGALYDHLCALTSALDEMLAERPAFERIHAPESNILCFRHRGDDAFNQALRERYNRSGQGWITSTVLGGRRVLRVTIMNPRTTEEHLVRLLDGLESHS
jgi:L-2,4-diaminobutyrate decarboxylase